MVTIVDSSIMNTRELARQRFPLIPLWDRTDINGPLLGRFCAGFANSAK
jgi:hypothetical protein